MQGVFANIYAPNKVRNQCTYFKELQDRLDGIISAPEQKVVIGGNFNVTFDSNLGCSGRSPAQKESVKVLEEICLDMDLGLQGLHPRLQPLMEPFFCGSSNCSFLQPRQLTFLDSQVTDFLEELGANLDGHLALCDAVSRQL